MTSEKRIFFATVGGSHQPLIEAIRFLHPDHTVFICTGGKSGSEAMITGEGKVIKSSREDKKPSLPNIPTQMDMQPEDFSVLLVPGDNLDEAVIKISTEMEKWRDEGELIADYTGGTKTMTAALVLASLELDVQLYLVKGARNDLDKVVDGTQCCSRAAVGRVRFSRELANYLTAWKQYGYSQALQGLNRMSPPAEETIQKEYLLARNLSKAFDAWDCFDHSQAYKLLSAHSREVGSLYGAYLQTAAMLANEDTPKAEGGRIYDLWLNAKRRVFQGRYDEAVARAYRIIEWIAQWVLYKDCEINTSDLSEDQIPEEVELFKNHKGKYQASLHKAWELVDAKTNGEAANFIRANKKDLLTYLDIRSTSILAHGFRPVGRDDWKKMESWMEEKLIPVLEKELELVGMKSLPRQLPCEYKRIEKSE